MELTKYQKCPVPEVAEYGVKSGMDHLELVFGCSREISGINTFSNKKTFFSKHSFLSINFSKKTELFFFSFKENNILSMLTCCLADPKSQLSSCIVHDCHDPKVNTSLEDAIEYGLMKIGAS